LPLSPASGLDAEVIPDARTAHEAFGIDQRYLELLHAGLGVLMAHYVASDVYAVRHCLALRVSRQLWIIAEHEDLPDWGLRPLYRTMAARWRVRAIHGLAYPRLPSNPTSIL
jgi:hypothetical protein